MTSVCPPGSAFVATLARHVDWLAATHHVDGHPVSGAWLAQQTSTVAGAVAGALLGRRKLRAPTNA